MEKALRRFYAGGAEAVFVIVGVTECKPLLICSRKLADLLVILHTGSEDGL